MICYNFIIFIKLINYKFYTGKYIIYETNIKGKEYDGYTDVLLFEGEYLNGEKNGKGKEYYHDGKLFFEGEYLNYFLIPYRFIKTII